VTLTHQPAVRAAPAGEEHLTAIAALASVVWSAYYPGILTHAQIDYMLAWMYSLETMRGEIRSKGIRYDRLLAGEELVGFASYGPADEPGVFKLHKLYLHPAWHGRGLGSLLLNRCEREARSLGARQLIQNVNKRNTKAIRAYERNGFQVLDSVVADIGGGFVMDDYVMGKEW
jgi:GNAT superfamily N-acetyltransferase